MPLALISVLLCFGCGESTQSFDNFVAGDTEATGSKSGQGVADADETAGASVNETPAVSGQQQHDNLTQNSPAASPAGHNAPIAAGAGPGGRVLTRPPALPRRENVPQTWPGEAEKEKLADAAVRILRERLRRICAGEANEQGFSYLADERSAYELHVESVSEPHHPLAEIVGDWARYDDYGKGNLTFTVKVAWPQVTVRSKPAKFGEIGTQQLAIIGGMPEVAAAEFPALLPWSEKVGFPITQYTVTFQEGEDIGNANINAKGRAAAWVMSLRYLRQEEKVKLLNLDQSSILSEVARRQYTAFRKRLPMMVHQLKGSLIILNQHLFPMVAGDLPHMSKWAYRLDIPLGEIEQSHVQPTHLTTALRTPEYREVDGIYPVSEIPGGQWQLWMTDEPVSDIDQLNGIEFRGKLWIAVRGYERGRYFHVRKWDGRGRVEPRVKLAKEWGDWAKPATRVGVISLTVDDGKVQWEPGRSGMEWVDESERMLDFGEWCLTQAEKDRLLGMLDVSDRKLREKPTWAALPF